jgi:predicted transglutaminase-like cysteine proteinase
MSHLRSATLRVLLTASLICAATPAIADGALPRDRATTIRAFPAVFGAGEVAGASLTPFKRWTAVLERILHETPAYDEPCALRFRGRCIAAEWRQLVRSLDGRARRERIDAVNAFFNRMPYIQDPGNWGVSDYWASPLQFLSRAGDCEDYAIAKFVTLRQLGFSNSELRLVVLDDLNLGIAHAVLVVSESERLLVLDNQIPDVVDSRRILHYKAIYSINEERWWLHRGK